MTNRLFSAHRPGVPLLSLLICALLCSGATRTDAAVALGIDVLRESNFAGLTGKRVGLITNQTGVDSSGTKTRLILKRAPGVRLVALYTPEHGLDGTEKAGKYISTRKDPLTGLTAFSLYGPSRKPTAEMLRGIDVLVFDMQDIGCRSYTYISTMAKCMEAAGENGIEFVVLDRPNPIGGERIEGPGIESRWISFVGQLPVPYVHGMTVGELARMANAKGWTGARCNLKVVPMKGWERGMMWRDTRLRWVRTSPNIPYGESPAYYVATGILGSLGGVDIGIGTSLPFQVAGAGWMNSESLAAKMRSSGIGGVRFEPTRTPDGSPGVRLHIDPYRATNLTEINLHLIAEFNKRTSKSLFARTTSSSMDIFYKVCGGKSIREKLAAGVPPRTIARSWAELADAFRAARKPFLMYK